MDSVANIGQNANFGSVVVDGMLDRSKQRLARVKLDHIDTLPTKTNRLVDFAVAKV